jgi:hypothetical protein
VASGAGNGGQSSSLSVSGIATILGAVTGAGALVYGLGLVTIFLSLHGPINTIPTTWYAASLVSKTVVILYGVKSLLWPAAVNTFVFILLLLLMFIAGRRFINWWAPLLGPPVSFWPVLAGLFGSLIALFSIALLWLFLNAYLPAYDLFRASPASGKNQYDFVSILYCGGVFPFRFGELADLTLGKGQFRNLFTCDNSLSGWFYIFMVLTIFGNILGATFFRLSRLLRAEAAEYSEAARVAEANRRAAIAGSADSTRYAEEASDAEAASRDVGERSRRRLLLAVAIVFLSTYFGAIALAVPRKPPLPQVALVEKGGQGSESASDLLRNWHGEGGTRICPKAIEGILLGHPDQFWYVLDKDHHSIAAFPDNEKGLVAVPPSKLEGCKQSRGEENSNAQKSQLSEKLKDQQREIDTLSNRIDDLDHRTELSTEAVKSLRNEAIKLRQQLREDEAY